MNALHQLAPLILKVTQKKNGGPGSFCLPGETVGLCTPPEPPELLLHCKRLPAAITVRDMANAGLQIKQPAPDLDTENTTA